jgi:hypothetical protein
MQAPFCGFDTVAAKSSPLEPLRGKSPCPVVAPDGMGRATRRAPGVSNLVNFEIGFDQPKELTSDHLFSTTWLVRSFILKLL